MMSDVARHLLTESDNKTHSIYKHLVLVGMAVGIALEIYVVGWKSQPFDIQSFGVGIGALFAGAGAALKMTPEAAPERTQP